jgi:hypothetical protein
MTEDEWLACTDPQPMLEFLRGKASDRKLRLFAVACCRRIWPLLAEEWSRQAVELAEKHADGLCSDEQLEEAGKRACWAAAWAGQGSAAEAAAWAAAGKGEAGWAEITAAHAGWAETAEESPRPFHCELLRDLFGSPFRPPAIDSTCLAWNGRTVPKFAQAIYENHTFNRLPELADALEEAGFANAEILSHLRGPGPHAKGCWALDLILGKT